MALLPAGTALPPLAHLLVLLVALAGVAYALRGRVGGFGERHVLALAPWMAVGSGLYVLYGRGVLPVVVAPLFGSPAVYATVAVLAGLTWLGADALGGPVGRTLAAVGLVGVVLVVGAVGWVGLTRGSLRPLPSAAALVVAAGLAAGAWTVLSRWRPSVAVTGRAGALVVLAHAVDGVSTAVGVDWLGFGERTPLSRLVIEFAAGLPTAPYVGGGWLFVVVKVALAAWIVTIMVDLVREEPSQGYALLGLVTAVGLGPGVHNLLLFAVAAG